MNDLLQETMRERAEGVEPPRVQIDSLMAAGERRRKRRGAATAGAVAVACAATVFGIVQLGGTTDDGGAPGYSVGGSGGFEQRRVTYSTGSTIHYGPQTIDVGEHDLQSFVQTDDGFVFADKDGTVYLADGSSVRELGSGDADGRYLKADDKGSYVSWVDSSGDLPEFVVYDTARMKEVVRTSEGNRPGMGTLPDEHDPVTVFALDGEGLYVRDGEGLARIDIPSGDSKLLRAGVDDGFEIPDVENGRILRDVQPQDDGNEALEPGEIPPGTVISRDPKAEKPLTVDSARDLSPDARYVSTDYNDSEQIVDTRTNDSVELDTSRYDFQAVTQWIDDDTIAVMTLSKPWSDPAVSMLACELPSGRCSVSADDIDYSDLQLPVGEHVERE